MSSRIVPIFRVADATASVEWYRQFGFEQVFEHRFEPHMPAYVGIEREGAMIHLSEHVGDASPHSLVYVWVDAVDPLAELVGASVDEMPWARDFEVADPDGNRLRFAEPIPREVIAGAPDGVVFRPAGDVDWPAIWPIVRSVIRAGDTYMFPPDLVERDARAAWLLDGDVRRQTYVGLLGGRVVATARLRPNHDGPGDHVANAAWMVGADAAGRGIGRRFGAYVLDEARRLGYHAMQFNAVVSTNHRAIRLWESLGFEIVGTAPDAFRHPALGLVPIHVMYRTL